jgi:hypothetical protein
MKNKTKHHEEIQNHIWNRKGKPFSFAEMKKKIHGATWYGGAKYKRYIKAKYGLREFKENGKVMLQRIPKENSSNNE